MTARTQSLAELLEERSISEPNGCRRWIGCVTHNGYGSLAWKTRTEVAHRMAYMLERGPIPSGYHVHHVCGNKLCINPDHLQALSPEDHVQLHARLLSHCVNGHERNDQNVFRGVLANGRSYSKCRACDRDRHRRDYHAQRAA